MRVASESIWRRGNAVDQKSPECGTAGRASGKGPLAGVVVLDLGIHRAGPHCALLLARLGADVIKVEPVRGEEARRDGVKWAVENNSKRSLAIDMRHPDGQRTLRALTRKADVLVQNFRPGVMRDMGLDIAEICAEAPRLIVASVSAYGSDSTLRDRPGFDGVMQAASGMMYVNGFADSPPLKFKSAIVDRMSGLHAALGVMAALHQRERTGRGQTIDVALCQSGYSIIDLELAESISTGHEPERTGNRASNPPVNNAFQTTDGWIYLATGGRDRMWVSLCTMIGKPEWLTEERFQSKGGRSANVDVIEEALVKFFGSKTRDEAIAACLAHRLPASPVRTVREAAASDYVAERDVVRILDTAYGRTPVMGDPWHFSDASVEVRPPPAVGADTHAILADLAGLGGEEIAKLIQEGVIQ